MELVQAIGEFLKMSWGFFKITVPGTNFTFAALFIGLFLACLGLDLLAMMVGVSYGHSEQQVISKLVKDSKAKSKSTTRH